MLKGAFRRRKTPKEKWEEQKQEDQGEWMGVEDTGRQCLLEHHMNHKWSLFTDLLLGGIMVN